MNKLILLLFIPFICFSQEDIERYKVYNTTNIYTSLLLDTATGKIWQLQIGVGDTDKLKTVLSEREYAKTIETITEEWNKEIEECDEYKEWINNNDLHEWLQKKEGIITSKEYNLRQDIKKIAKNKFCKKNKK